MKVLIIAEDGFEDLELFYPLYRLREENIDVIICSSDLKEKVGKKGYVVSPNLRYEDVRVDEFDALLIPGGKSPERARIHRRAVEIVKAFAARGKPIAAICHGPQLLISAGLVKGRRVTSWIGIRDDLVAAGAVYEDREVVVDGRIITSRKPDDLPAFCRELLRLLRINEIR